MSPPPDGVNAQSCWPCGTAIRTYSLYKQNPEFTLGDMNLKYTDKYKYLGYLQNNKNNLDDHIKATKAKVENAYQTLLAIAGNKNFSNIEMQTIWELTQCCITSTIAYSTESWSPGKTENEKINRIMDNILKRILMVPQSTPREALYIETGLLNPEAMRLKKQSANGTQIDEWHKPENEKVHNKQ